MESKRRIIGAALFLLLSFGQAGRGQVDLKLKFDGPKATQMVRTEVTQVLSHKNQTFRRNIVQDLEIEKNFKSAPNGSETRNTITSIKVVLTLPDGRQLELPEDGSEPDDPLLANYRALVGAAWIVKRDNNLEVKEVELVEDFKTKVESLLPIIRSRFSPDTLKKMEESEQARLPSKAVKSGPPPWSSDYYLPLVGKTGLLLGCEYTYVEIYKEGGRDLHRVRFSVQSVKYEPAEDPTLQSSGNFTVEQPSTGEYSFDAELGRIVKMEDDTKIKGNLSIEGVATELELHIKRTLKPK